MMASPKPRFKRHILAFDLDGTLVDSGPDLAGAVNALFAEQKLPAVTLDDIRRWVGDGAPVLLQRALAHVGATQTVAELFPRFTHHYGENAVRLTTVYPAVAETLADLEALGCRMGVCTNKPFKPTMQVLEAFDLARYFGAVIGGDSLPQRKPDPEPLWRLIDDLGGTADQAAMLGDSATDLACAEAAGIPAVIIPSGYGMEAPRATAHTIGSFDELRATLERL